MPAPIVALLALLLVPALGAAPEAADGAGQRTDAVWPLAGPVLRTFDPPADPYGAGHRGVDLAAAPGSAVHAVLPGTVRFAGPVAGTRWITLDHGDGLETTYGDVRALVAPGARVAAGEPIGILSAAATHLDWGARLDGAYVDPLGLLGRWRARLVPVDEPVAGIAGAPPAPPSTATGPAAGAGRLVWPLRGRVSSPFGPRVHPVHGGLRIHTGVDLAAPVGTPVVAAAGGQVVGAGLRGGHGLLVEIDHGGGRRTRYAHLSAATVGVGQVVVSGQPIGAVGMTGTTTGPHLHFELREGQRALDPLPHLP